MDFIKYTLFSMLWLKAYFTHRFNGSITRRNQSMTIDHRKFNRSIDNNRWQLVDCYRLLMDNL